METQPVISKLKTFLKISVCSFVCLGMSSVHAEYYLVASGGGGCGYKKHHRYVKRYRVRHRRCGCRPRRVVRHRCPRPCDDYSVWQGTPCGCGVGCGGVWARPGVGCGSWMPDAWANDYYYSNMYGGPYDYSYNYDLATGDDNPYINPDLQINY